MPTKRNEGGDMDVRHVGNKKASKPLMEKRRRARINHCLAQLKALVVDPSESQRARQAKLEKADILELTVRHLQDVKRRHRTVSLLDVRHPRKKFEIGYVECVREVDSFLSNSMEPLLNGPESELQRRLKDHLCRKLQDFRKIELLGDVSKTESSSSEEESGSAPSSAFLPSFGNESEIPKIADTSDRGLEPLEPIANFPCNSLDNASYSTMLDLTAKRELNDPTIDRKWESQESTLRHLKSENTDGRMSSSSSDFCQTVPEDLRFVPFHSFGETRNSPPATEESSTFRDLSNNMRLTSLIKNPLKWSSPVIENSTPEFPLKSETVGQNFQSCESPVFDGPQETPCLEQIPLVPKRLPTGHWALVLPQSLSFTEHNISGNLSAFRVVFPSDVREQSHHPQSQCSSSPLSSSVSEMSVEDLHSGLDAEPVDGMDRNSQTSRFVWRPW